MESSREFSFFASGSTMVFTNNTDGKTAQVQNHQLESTTSSPKSSGEANPDENIIVDLMNDVAFKHVFSQKKFMIPLLNAVLRRENDPIADISYLPTEHVAEQKDGVTVVFDLNCLTSDGKTILVEMQYDDHEYFRERTLYYMARKIGSQLEKLDAKVRKTLTEEQKQKLRKEKYRLIPTYGIFLTGFHLEEDNPRLLRDVILTDQLDGNRQFTDMMRMIYVELPFIKNEENCTSFLEKLTYVINNSRFMETMPFTDNPFFKDLDEAARFFNMPLTEQEEYEYLQRNRLIRQLNEDFKIKKAEEKGLAKGEAKAQKEKHETARKLISEEGWSIEKAASLFGLSPEEITQD